MQRHLLLRSFLVLSALIAVGIGAAILFAPADFHAASGIALSGNASLASELRAPGANLLALGLVMGAGVFARRLLFLSTAATAIVYGSYGLARLLSYGLDGEPAPSLVQAMAIELAIAALACTAIVALRRARPAAPRPALG